MANWHKLDSGEINFAMHDSIEAILFMIAFGMPARWKCYIVSCKREIGNWHDFFAVSVVKLSVGTVGHLPKKYLYSIQYVYAVWNSLFTIEITWNGRCFCKGTSTSGRLLFLWNFA